MRKVHTGHRCYLTAAHALQDLCPSGWSQNCQDQDTGWEKIIGAKPANAVEIILYKNAISNNGIIVPCFDR